MLQNEIAKHHIENKKYSRRHFLNEAKSLQNPISCLSYEGVTTHVQRQQIAQKEKENISKMLETGVFGTSKKSLKTSRVTIPKKKYQRKYIRESMDVILKQSVPSPETNQQITTRDLVSKGFTFEDVVMAANDIEEERIESMQRQFLDPNGVKIEDGSKFKSAVETLHQYLHSFDL